MTSLNQINQTKQKSFKIMNMAKKINFQAKEVEKQKKLIYI